MKITLINPPGGYQYMVYLANPMLKGYLDTLNVCETNQIDLTSEYNSFIWNKNTINRLLNKLRLCVDSSMKNLYYYLACKILSREIEKVYNSMKKIDSYKDRSVIEYNIAIFNLLNELIGYIDLLNGYEGIKQPKKIGEFDDIISRFENSVMGKWLFEYIDERNLEENNLIGISVTYDSQLIPALLIAKLIKQKNKNTKIMMGGNLITYFKNEILSDCSFWSNVDYVSFYQGEYKIKNIIEHMHNSDISLKNIAYFYDKKIYYESDNNEILTVKEKIIPNFDGINLDLFPTPYKIIPILASKGCYWGKCAYCSHYEGYGAGYFRYDGDFILNLISTLKHKYGVEYFYFVDEALPYGMIKYLSARLIDNNYNIKWYSEARIEKTFSTIENLKLLKESGCISLIYGIESGNQSVLDSMNKGIKISDVKIQLKNCKEVGIKTICMFFVGFPTEEKWQSESTFNFIRDNKNNITFATIGVFTLEKNSDVYNNFKNYGIEYIEKYDIDLYHESPNYKLLRESNISTYRSRYNLLKDIYANNKDIEGIFTGNLNRESLLFVEKEYFDCSNPYNIKNEKIDIGKFKGNIAEIDFINKKMKILKEL